MDRTRVEVRSTDLKAQAKARRPKLFFSHSKKLNTKLFLGRNNLKPPNISAGPEALLLVPQQQGGNRIKKSGKPKRAESFGKRTKFRTKTYRKNDNK